MRAALALCLLALPVAAEPVADRFYANDSGAVLHVEAVSPEGFDFALQSAADCPEGETTCLVIFGHAVRTAKGYTYADDYDPASRIFFADEGDGLRILQTSGDLGTGTANRAAKLTLPGPYVPQDDAGMEPQFTFFRSPTGNIGCLFVSGEGTDLRCDLLEFEPTYAEAPADCEFDYGGAFWVGELSETGEVLCASDTVVDPAAEVLDYDQSLTEGGITCLSEKSGMTCTNEQGHGFTLSRRAQKVF